jgi:hypothetical protein
MSVEDKPFNQFESPYTQSAPRPNKHAALISAWIKDMRKPLQCNDGYGWQDCEVPENEVPTFNETMDWRFKPTKPECVSTLTYDEIVELVTKSPYEGDINKAVRVANAACKAERERIAGLPAVTSLSVLRLDSLLYPPGIKGEYVTNVANTAIAQFQRDLLEGKI